MKPCPACGGRNSERSQFCHTCGGRLPEGEGIPANDQTGAADPLSSSIYGNLPVEAAPPPTAASCAACGYSLAPGQQVSWCPGCGRLFEAPVTGTPTPSAPVAAPAPMDRTVTPVGIAPPAGLPPPPGWSLVLLKAGERLDRYPLRKPEVVLGRSEGDFNFPEDQLLSPRHARLVSRGKAYGLEDAGSRNGTFLRLSAPEELRHEDVITFGSLVFRYESAAGGPTTSLITTEAGVKLFGSGTERARGRLV